MKKISDRLKFYLLNALTAIILISGITWGVLNWLEDYTQHGIFISVPAFYDLTPDEAESIATHNRLRIMVVDSLFDENAKPGTIIEQYPASGSQVKENRMIHLTINASNPEKVIFPNLQNAAYRQTLQTLTTRGFKIGNIEYEPSEFKNLVLTFKNKGTTIQPGALLNKGATVDIVLGSGNGSNTVIMPPLKGKTLREAIDILRTSYLNIGEIIPDGSITNENEKYSALIYMQVPRSQEIIDAGSVVNLYITLKKEKLQEVDSTEITQ